MFQKSQLPYDKQLEQKTLQEQRDLALRHAQRLAARGPLRGLDLYYTGIRGRSGGLTDDFLIGNGCRRKLRASCRSLRMSPSRAAVGACGSPATTPSAHR